MVLIFVLLLFGAGAYIFSSGMLTNGKTPKTGATLNTPYYIYFKKEHYHDLSQDERFKDMGKWTAYSHESFKLVTDCKRQEVQDRIKETLGLNDDDFKIVANMDMFIP